MYYNDYLLIIYFFSFSFKYRNIITAIIPDVRRVHSKRYRPGARKKLFSVLWKQVSCRCSKLERRKYTGVFCENAQTVDWPIR